MLLRRCRWGLESGVVPLDGHSLNNIFPFCRDVGIAVGERMVVLSTVVPSTGAGDNMRVLNMVPGVVFGGSSS
jgi:hypothetical protein